MTIRVDVSELTDLQELLAHIEAGEDVVLTRDGQPVATVNGAKPEDSQRGPRIPGQWAKYGRLEDPDLFLRPDPELEALMDAPIFPDET